MRTPLLVATVLAAALPMVLPAAAQGQVGCPQAAGADAEAGWTSYRAGDMAAARARFVAALTLCPGDPYASTGMGYVALREGAREEARQAFHAVVSARPDDVDALVGLGILAWWDGDRGGAEARFLRVLELVPDNSTAREYLDRIRAAAALPPPHEAAPAPRSGVEANLGLGGSLVLAGDARGAVAAFREALAADPGNQAALVGLGRALTWGGLLQEGEETLRRARAADPADMGAVVALAQNLRWQGRTVAALELLEAAARVAPHDGDVQEQRRWVDATLSPQVRPGVTVEWDSEDNHVVSATMAASFRPVPRLTLRADSYRRSLEIGLLRRWSQGATVSAQWEAEPGWSVSGGVGGSRNDGSGRASLAAWSAAISSPRRHALSGSVTLSSAAFDVTAPVAERGIRLTEAAASGQWTPSAGWRVEGTAGLASFQGSQDNPRTSAAVSVFRPVGRRWTLGGGVRAFSFGKDLDDGYFDPDFFGIAELSARWMHESGPWTFVAEVAPALQQVTSDGDPATAVRGSGRISFRLAPGREIAAFGGVSSTGLQSSSTGGSDYRYRALGLGGVWAF